MRRLAYQIQKIIGLFIIKTFELLVIVFSDVKVSYANSLFPELKEIQKAWKDIKNEYDAYVKEHSLDNMSEIFIEQARIAGNDNWKNVMLLIYGVPIPRHQMYFPITSELIKKNKNIRTAFFSVLPPGKKIETHVGPYKGVLRYHLGLDIHQSKECFLEIEKKRYYWEEGKVFIFDDTFTHRAQNMSEDYRVILFLDILRPLPNWLQFLNMNILNLIQRSPLIQNVLHMLEAKQVEGKE